MTIHQSRPSDDGKSINFCNITAEQAKSAFLEVRSVFGGDFILAETVGKELGVIFAYSNKSHSQNLYVLPFFNQEGEECCAEIFASFQKKCGRPLQCMLNSDDERIKIITLGGFRLARQCYEREFAFNDLKEKTSRKTKITLCCKGEEAYNRASKLLYRQYEENHVAINPLSESFEEFVLSLPDCCLCAESGEKNGFAFVQDNEICYVGGLGSLKDFLLGVVNHIFENYSTVEFEADDNDLCAMQLKSLFTDNSKESYNTYVFGI